MTLTAIPNKYAFEEARKLYPGTCRGFDDEWDNFMFQLKKPASRRKHRTVDNVTPLLKPAIEVQIAHREELARKKEFVPPWKHFKTWINGGWWTEELPQDGKPKRSKCESCGELSTRSVIVYYRDGAKNVRLCDKCPDPENIR